MIQLRENGNFYRTGRGKHFIGVEEILLSGRQIKDGNSEDAVKIMVHPADGRFQLLPQHLLFLLGCFFLRNLLRKASHWCPNYGGEQSKKEKSFQHGDLRVSAIIRPNGRKQRKSKARNSEQQQAGWTELQEARWGFGRTLCGTQSSWLLKRHSIRTTIGLGT